MPSEPAAPAPARRPSVLGLAVVASVLLGLALPAPGGRAAPADPVDVALVLAVDVSSSVNDDRYQLQMQGISRAFLAPEVQNAILSGPHHAIAVTLVQWSDEPHVSIPWTRLGDLESLVAFAARVREAPRTESDFTCMAEALEIIDGKILPVRPVQADRVIIDVSGDGQDNCNPDHPVDALRDRLVGEGATINGLPILEGAEADTLEKWYGDHLVGGASSFLLPAHGFEDLERAMRQKFLIEISRIDAPVSRP